MTPEQVQKLLDEQRNQILTEVKGLIEATLQARDDAEEAKRVKRWAESDAKYDKRKLADLVEKHQKEDDFKRDPVKYNREQSLKFQAAKEKDYAEAPAKRATEEQEIAELRKRVPEQDWPENQSSEVAN